MFVLSPQRPLKMPELLVMIGLLMTKPDEARLIKISRLFIDNRQLPKYGAAISKYLEAHLGDNCDVFLH